MRWLPVGRSLVALLTAAMAHRFATRGHSSTLSAVAIEPQAQAERSTVSVLALGSSSGLGRGYVAAVEPLLLSESLAPSAEPGSREATVELLAGIVEAIGVEASEADDYEVSERLVWLLVDVLDAKDALEG